MSNTHFNISVTALPGEGSGTSVDLKFDGARSLQISGNEAATDVYDQIVRVSWVFQERTYEATICRARKHGNLGK